MFEVARRAIIIALTVYAAAAWIRALVSLRKKPRYSPFKGEADGIDAALSSARPYIFAILAVLPPSLYIWLVPRFW